MALLWLEGFETFKSDDWLDLRYTRTGNGVSSVAGRYGGNAAGADANAGTQLARTVLDTADGTLTIGFWLRLSAAPTAVGKFGLSILLAGSPQLTLRAIESGEHEWKLELRHGGQVGTVIETQTGTAQFVGKWHFVEIQATLHTSTGAYEVRVDGTNVMSDTGLDTAGTASNDADGIQIRLGTSGGLDDLYVLDDTGTANNDFLGPIAIEGRRPNANGNQNDWTPTSGDNYTNVDEDGLLTLGTDRVSSHTIGEVDLYGFQDLLRVNGSPTFIGVVLASVLAMEASGSRDVNHITRSGGSEDSADAATVTGGVQTHHHDVFEVNPVSTAAWTVATLNAAEFGVEIDA